MAILFIDGCDHSLNVAEKGYVSKTGTGTDYSTTQKRTGTRGLRIFNSNNSGAAFISKVVTAGATLRTGFGFYVDDASPPIGLVTFRDNATDQLTLRINADLTISAYRGAANGTLLGTSTVKVKAEFWHHLEVKAVISDTVGTVDVWLDNVSILALTSQDTKATANASADRIVYGITIAPNGISGGNPDIYFDDIIISDDASTRIGTATVQTIYPTGAGATTQWTPSTGNNWAAVDEATANSDTDYVSTSGAGNIDTYVMGNLTVSPASILAVAVNVVARDDAGGTNSIAAMVRSGGTDYAQASTATTATYVNYQSIIATDPATSAAWTGANVDAVEIGVKRI